MTGKLEAFAQKVRKPFQSRNDFITFLRTDGESSEFGSRWSNKDLDPTLPAQRHWRWYSLTLYWAGSAFGITGWNVAASLIAVGLSWQQAFISCVIGSLLTALVVVALARPGASYHIGYPVLCRGVMGMYGSYFFVFIRAIVSSVWYGIQTVYGANLLSICFYCMFGDSWNNFPNALPLSANITSKQLLCFFLIWLVELPFCFVHPSKIHWLFSFKGVLMPVVTFGLFGWCMHEGGGISAINNKVAVAAQGVPTGWAVMAGINTIMGTVSPLLVNQPDLARYCVKPSDAGWHQGLAVWSTKTIVFFLGLASTASIQSVYGTAYWNMWDLLNAILAHHWTPAARCAVFLVALSFLVSVIGINLGSNSIPFGADLTGITPKYLTIKRGQVLCAILGLAFVPWKLLASAQSFLMFLGSYNIFMAPICSVIIVDYIFAKKGNLHVPSLYDSRPGALYMFTRGANYRGVAAWIAAVSLGIPGLIGAYLPSAVNDAAKNMYKIGWPLTFFTGAAVYGAGLYFFPMQAYPEEHRSDVPYTWEYMVKNDGYFEDEINPNHAQGIAEVLEELDEKITFIEKE